MTLALSFILAALILYWLFKNHIHFNDLKKQAKDKYGFDEKDLY